MNDQVSLGSQPQYRPHAWSAQMAPAMTPNVQIGKPKTTARYVSLSSCDADGTRSSSALGSALPAATRFRYRSVTRYMMPSTAATKKMPVARVIAVTWIDSQYDCRAGTSGPAGVLMSASARPSATTTAPMTNTPSVQARYRTRM